MKNFAAVKRIGNIIIRWKTDERTWFRKFLFKCQKWQSYGQLKWNFIILTIYLTIFFTTTGTCSNNQVELFLISSHPQFLRLPREGSCGCTITRIVQSQAWQGFEWPDLVEDVPVHDQGRGLGVSGVESGGGEGRTWTRWSVKVTSKPNHSVSLFMFTCTSF